MWMYSIVLTFITFGKEKGQKYKKWSTKHYTENELH